MSYQSDYRTSAKVDVWLAFFGLLLVVPLTIFNGWVGSVIWNWFIPNIFVGAPQLTIGKAIGLSLVISAFTYKLPKDDEKNPWMSFSRALFGPIFVGVMLLVMGAIVHAIVF